MRHHHRAAGLALAVLSLVLSLVAASQALAAVGDTAYIRIEGQSTTLVPRTPVVLQAGTVPGNSGCPMSTVGGAIELATHGNWDRSQGKGGLTQTIAGETHKFDNSDYWAGWVNNRYGGAFCGQELSQNDEVLVLVDVSEPVAPFRSTVFALTLGTPRAVTSGQQFTVSATYYDNQATPAAFPEAGNGFPKPAAGVTISGGGASAVTGADGKARIRLSHTGTVLFKGTKGGMRTTTYPVCVQPPDKSSCGVPVKPVAPRPGTVTGISGGQHFSAGSAPRRLAGRFVLGNSGLRSVRLRLQRTLRSHCQYYSALVERFRGTRRCGANGLAAGYYWYRIGQQADWSYLLPQRLGPGRYVLEVAATDRRGTRVVKRVVFTVLPASRARARAAAGAPLVDVFVAGRSRILTEPSRVRASSFTARVAGKRCAVAAGTPLAALDAARRAGGPGFTLRDFGSCSRRAVDAGGLYVTRVGPDVARARDGWVSRVGRRVGTAGAADPGGPFGTGPLRAGSRVTWFWCRLDRSGGCQRALEVTPSARRVAPGAALRVLVRGFDNNGRGVRIAGARVTLGGQSAVSGADGFATVRAPATAGAQRLGATHAGLVPAFPLRVAVG